ncbi:MAG: ArsR family transcriptional regulator [Bdellovibrionota bacterium]
MKSKSASKSSKKNEEVITVSSWEVLARVFSPARLEILSKLSKVKPLSISGLAKSLKKDFKNVYSDVMFLADLGLIEIEKRGSKNLVPVSKYEGIEFNLAA